MKQGYNALYDQIHADLVRYSIDPEVIYQAAPLVLIDLWMGLWRDAPNNDLRRRMGHQLIQYLIDEHYTAREEKNGRPVAHQDPCLEPKRS